MRSAVKDVAVATIILTALLAGCGGTGDAPSVVGSAGVEGTVYAPTVDTTCVTTAGAPCAGCQVIVEQTQTRRRLGQTQADGEGRYEFRGLNAGECVTIRARLENDANLRVRLRLRDGTCQGDIDEDTTMAAAAVEALEQAGTVDAFLDDTVQQVCSEYQNQYRYQYQRRQGQAPSFADEAEVADAGADLLAAATEGAVRRALQTRLRTDCEQAVAMVEARIRQQDGLQFGWDEETRAALGEAMRAARRISVQRAAQVAGDVLSTEVTQADICAARDRIRQRIAAFNGQEMEACECLAGLCLGQAEQVRARLRTRSQARRCASELASG